MTYREQGGRQLSLPCPCSCPSQKTLDEFHVRNSSVDRNNSRPLYPLAIPRIWILITILCSCCGTLPQFSLYKIHLDALNFVLPTFWYRHCIFMTTKNVWNWQVRLNVSNDPHRTERTTRKIQVNIDQFRTVVTQAESIVPHLQLSNVGRPGHLVNNLFKLRYRF